MTNEGNYLDTVGVEDGEGLPSGWVNAEIGVLCDLQNGRAFKPSEWSESGLPIVRIQNLNNPKSSFNYFQGVYDERNFLQGGELLFAWSGTPGTSFGAHVWSGKEALLNQHIFRVDFNERHLDKRFFRHAINQQLNELIDIAHGGVGLRHVTKGKFEATPVPLPPLAEQIRIADKLDALLSRVDLAQERLERVPKLIKQFRQSVLSAAVSGELTREWREDQCDLTNLTREIIEAERRSTWNKKQEKMSGRNIYKTPLPLEVDILPEIPANWHWASVDEITEFVTDGEHATPKRTPAGILLLSARNVIDGQLRLETVDYISEETHAILSRRILPQKGDVLLSCSGTVGRSCVVPDGIRFSLVRSVAIMRPLLDFGNWLSYCFRSPQLQEMMSDRKTETAQANLFQGKIKVLPIPLPPLLEQAEIVRRVEALFSIADRLEQRYAQALSSFSSLTPALLAKAFRGELVPQDPNDEPASVLLERIRAQRAESGEKPKRGRGAGGAGKAGRPRKAQVEGQAATEPKRRGRPPKNRDGIPQASSDADAIRQLEERKLERAQGTRQVGLFDE